MSIVSKMIKIGAG